MNVILMCFLISQIDFFNWLGCTAVLMSILCHTSEAKKLLPASNDSVERSWEQYYIRVDNIEETKKTFCFLSEKCAVHLKCYILYVDYVEYTSSA